MPLWPRDCIKDGVLNNAMQEKFVHLHLHTEYSINDGLLTIPKLMQRAARFGMGALALTDQNNLYAAIKFYTEALKHGIKPIIGADIDLQDEDSLRYKLTVLCQNNQGYLNLLKLLSKSYLDGQIDGRPTIHKEWLQTQGDGLIILAGQKSDLGQALLNRDTKKIHAYQTFYSENFAQRFYLEVTRIDQPQENHYLQAALCHASKAEIPIVATNDVRFLETDDFEAHEARVCIQEGYTLLDQGRPKNYTEQQYFRDTHAMCDLFQDLPSAITNSYEIAKRCNVTLSLGENKLPFFEVPPRYTSENYLREVAHLGLTKRIASFTTPLKSEDLETYRNRLDRELDVINKMGFAGYFLIVADFTKWAKDNEIPVGPGRGSGPGSLVAYALHITDLDPISLELLFERFLNPERVSMPDFDIDFCMEGRDRVIEYVMQKHGQDSVSQIITYGTMAARAVVRDVGRVLGFTYGFVDKIAKLIPFELGITLDKAMKQEALLRARYDEEEEVRNLIDLALKLEGITRNVGKHAGGIVIAPGKLTDFVPLYCEQDEREHPVTQFDKDDVEAVGLVKFDFLGLKTLTIIARALHIINARNDQKIDIGMIPLNDVKTFQLLKACKSTAVFQLESHGMRDLIKRLQPDVFEDLIALVALFRPGPLQSGMVDDFINRKHGRARVLYPHPKLEPILRPTYGVILYQEQVMQIAQVLAGYTLGAADILRRAMGKKKPEEMAKQREIFCQGAHQRGVPLEKANQIFDLMEKFAGYGFNKSHSASYALIAYQTAWLKAHYPAAFMAAVLSSDMDRTEKILLFLEECKSLQLTVCPPNINESHYYFTMVDDANLTYGLGAIKGVGQAAIECMIAARKAGPFENLFDFCERVDLRKVNRRVLEALIKSGCLDCFQQNRATLMTTVNRALQHAEQQLHNLTHGQQDLLSMAAAKKPTYEYVKMPEWHQELKLQNEKATLGFYLSGHPLERFKEELPHLVTCCLNEILPGTQQLVRVAGIISNLRQRQTRRGDKIGIFTLDDGHGSIEVVCFSESFQKYRSLINEEQVVIIEGDVNMDEFSSSPRLVAKELLTLDDIRCRMAKGVQILFDSTQAFDLEAFKQLIKPHMGGPCPVILRYQKNNVQADIRLGKNWQLKPSESLFKSIENQLSIQSVAILYQ